MLDLNEALAGMLKMLRRLLGEDIGLTWMSGKDLWPVKMDPSQLGQLLVNLGVNARDAIAGVGKVTISTANSTLDSTHGSEPAGTTSGEYVMLAVSDSGCGMTSEVLAHIFEPFFTTKEIRQGTGLGLATVHGIVEQNHGRITVTSQIGEGTTFCIYLPRAALAAEPAPAVAPSARPPRVTETVLVAEDEKSVRVTARLFLEALGYTVLVAGTPDEALRLASAHPGPIQLLISDVIMPGMDGPDLAERLAAVHAGMKCLFISGYTADIITQRGALEAGVMFMAKPFSRNDLAHKVREVLDGNGETTPARGA